MSVVFVWLVGGGYRADMSNRAYMGWVLFGWGYGCFGGL